MRNFTITKLGCTACALLLCSFGAQQACAGGTELSTTEPLDDAAASAVTTTDDGQGNFSRLPFHVSASVRGGYDDNVFTSTFDRQGSAFTNESLTLSYDFGSPRTQIDLRTGAGITNYFDRPGSREYDLNGFLAATINHRASARLSLSASLYATYQDEPDFGFNAGLNRISGNYFFTVDKFSVGYQWAPRFSTVTSYTVDATDYDDDSIGLYEDRVEHTFGNEFRFLLDPTTTLVAEYRYEIIDYDRFPRDSTSNFVLGGFDHNFSPRFSISIRGGAEFREYDQFGEKTAPYFEGTLIYALGPHLSVTWTNRYGLEEPDVPGSSSRTTFRTGLQARYNITPKILLNLGFYYEHDDNSGQDVTGYVSPAFVEDSYSVSISARYAITRIWAFELGYDFSDVDSEIDLRSYYRNRFYGGVNLSF